MSRHSQSHGVTIPASMCSVEFGVAHDFAIEEKESHNAACFPSADNKYAKQKRIASETDPSAESLKRLQPILFPLCGDFFEAERFSALTLRLNLT